jgi:hypothetical protein
MLSKIYHSLLYITNNETESKDEVLFDIIGFIVSTIAVIAGTYLFIKADEKQWMFVLWIEYLWYLDNMRNNRIDLSKPKKRRNK